MPDGEADSAAQRPGIGANQQQNQGPADGLRGSTEARNRANAAEDHDLDADTFVAKAAIARENAEHVAALQNLKDAVSKDPKNVAIKLDIARTLRDIGRYEEAKNYCLRALDLSPSNVRALNVLGSIALRLKDYASALDHFEALGRLRPNNDGNQVDIARALLKLERFDDAEALCRGLMDKPPVAVRARSILSSIAERNGDFPAAIEHIEFAISLEPENNGLKLKAIRLLRDTDHAVQAEIRCRTFLENHPDSVEAIRLLGSILRLKEDFEGALEQIEIAAARVPEDQSLRLAIASLLRTVRRTDEARSTYAAILKNSPDNFAAISGLASIARSDMKLPEALALFQRSVEIDPNDPVAHIEIASLLFELFRYDESAIALARAEACAASRPSIEYNIRKFDFFCQTTQWDKAAEILAAWPDFRDIPQSMVLGVTRYLAEQDRWDDLLDFFRVRVVEKNWSNRAQRAEAMFDAVASAVRRAGRYQEVLSLLDSWKSGASNGGVQNLREQLNEELSLLRALEAPSGASCSIPDAISNAVRKTRHGRILGALAPRQAHTPAILRARTVEVPRDTIFFCTDAKYLLGATASLFSALRHNATKLTHCRFVVYCSTDCLEFASKILHDIADYFGCRIEARSSATLFANGARLRTKWGRFTAGLGLSEAAYYRMFAALQFKREAPTGRALYIDADTSCGPGIDDLLAFDLENRPLGARREDPDMPAIRRATIRLGLSEGEYFNSGILLFDLTHDELEPALQRSIDVALHQQHLLAMVDQCAFNVGFKGWVTSLDAKDNFFITDDEALSIPVPIPVVTHFTQHPKPWDPFYRNRQCLRWFDEFDAFGEVLQPDDLKRLFAAFFPQPKTKSPS